MAAGSKVCTRCGAGIGVAVAVPPLASEPALLLNDDPLYVDKPARIRRKIAEPVEMPAPPSPLSAKTTGWRTASVLLAIAAIISAIGWYKTRSELKNIDSNLSNTRSTLLEQQNQKASLEEQLRQAQQALEEEKKTRRRLAGQWPVTLTEIALRNENGQEAIGGFDDSFPADDIRYIRFHITLQNNFTGLEKAAGKLGVKYVAPDGILLRNPSTSPPGFTFEREIEIEDLLKINQGWGQADRSVYSTGEHRVEFWWAGRKIGEKSFVVE
ncbi:MAG: hypothetical protein ACREEM_23515 [Blastocatellia bacterium]